MGASDAERFQDREELRIFMKRLLSDLRALEQLLAQDAFEVGVRRIGAEQELFLVDRCWRPSPCAPEILKALNDPRFTDELAKFNLDPITFGRKCLSDLEANLNELLAVVRAAAAESMTGRFLNAVCLMVQDSPK